MGSCVLVLICTLVFFHSLIEFFRKIKKWSEMAKLSSGFTEKVETLERKFEVASIIFDKYKKEFCDIFQCPEDKQTPGGVRQCGRKSSKYATPFALHCVDCHDDELFVLSYPTVSSFCRLLIVLLCFAFQVASIFDTGSV